LSFGFWLNNLNAPQRADTPRSRAKRESAPTKTCDAADDIRPYKCAGITDDIPRIKKHLLNTNEIAKRTSDAIS
jgi:hypothetical protein